MLARSRPSSSGVDADPSMILQVRFLKIPIRIHFWFFVTAGVLFLLFTEAQPSLRTPAAAAITLGVVFQGIFMHELGHALLARAFGLEPRVELLALGGRTWWEANEPLNPWRSLLVSAAGPAIGIVMGAVALIVAAVAQPASPIALFALELFVYVNLWWALFNLLPMLPLDGGNIVASFFELVSKEHGRRVARYLSLALLAFAAAWIAATQPLVDPSTWMLLLFVALFATTNYRALRIEDEIARRLAAGTILLTPRSREEAIEQAHQALEEGNGRKLTMLAAHLIGTAQDVDVRDEGIHLLAWGRLLMGDADEASAALDAMSGRREADPALRGSVLLAQGYATRALPFLWSAIDEGRGDTFVESRLLRALEEGQGWEQIATRLEAGAHRLSADTLERLQSSSFSAGALQLSQQLGEVVFRDTGSAVSAFNVACSLSRQGKTSDALDWLRRAYDAGLDDVERLDTDEDLEAVRALPSWPKFRASISEA